MDVFWDHFLTMIFKVLLMVFTKGTDMQNVFRKLQTQPKLSSEWASSVSAVKTALQNFEGEAMLYCSSTMKAFSGEGQPMKTLVDVWRQKSETKERIDAQLFASFLFFQPSYNTYVAQEVDTSYLRTMRVPLARVPKMPGTLLLL